METAFKETVNEHEHEQDQVEHKVQIYYVLGYVSSRTIL